MTLEECRRFYAEEIQYAANLKPGALVEAFARVPRESFLGMGPWQIGAPDLTNGRLDYATTANANARHVYHNVVVALDPARRLNNGQPSSLAMWINALDLQPGNRVFHLGCGVGYYTAIIAEVVGPAGSVFASEVDSELATRAARNLAAYPNVSVHAGDGATADPGMCDAIFVNAGVTHPHRMWLDRLADCGRLLLPLTFPMPSLAAGAGIMAKIVRQGTRFTARTAGPVAIYSCTSVRDARLEPELKKAMSTGALFKLKSLRVEPHAPDDTCLVHSETVCLSSTDIGAQPAAPVA
jgi:protein-L-isoaspartate(D-aspartate) O-methyltransferase